MILRRCWLLLVVVWLAGVMARAQQITWESDPGSVVLTGAGMPMSGTFVFELGVFTGSFVPSQTNTSEWSANWVLARRVTCNAPDGYFTDDCIASNHSSPFVTDKEVYVWGFQGGASASEWILFRNNAWTWPAPPQGPPPFPLLWNAKAATAIVGSIHAGGTPFQMQSATVSDAASPPTTWLQWQSVELAAEPILKGPNDDPDHDGTPNLLEYVFGTPPLQAGAPPATPVRLVTVDTQRFLQMSIPRRIDHPATLIVQVSPDLTHWDAGDAFTTVISNLPGEWVVRDRTPLAAAHPQRFMRLKVELPAQ